MSRTPILITAIVGLAAAGASGDRVVRFVSDHGTGNGAAAPIHAAGLSSGRSQPDTLSLAVFTAANSERASSSGMRSPGAFVFDHTRPSAALGGSSGDAARGRFTNRPGSGRLQDGNILSDPQAEQPSFLLPGNAWRLSGGEVVVRDGSDPEVVVPLPSAAMLCMAGLAVVACRRHR